MKNDYDYGPLDDATQMCREIDTRLVPVAFRKHR